MSDETWLLEQKVHVEARKLLDAWIASDTRKEAHGTSRSCTIVLKPEVEVEIDHSNAATLGFIKVGNVTFELESAKAATVWQLYDTARQKRIDAVARAKTEYAWKVLNAPEPRGVFQRVWSGLKWFWSPNPYGPLKK